jgi:hypothetical protein
MYVVYADVEWLASGGRNRNYDVRLNGGATSILGSSQNTNAGGAGQKGTSAWQTSALWQFNANDYVDLYTDTRQDKRFRYIEDGPVYNRGGLGLVKVASGVGARVSSPSGTGTLQWADEVFDVGGLFDAGSSTRLTAPSTGLYYISSQIRWAPDSEGYSQVPYIWPNSTTSYRYEIDGDNRSASIRLNGSNIIAKESRQGGIHDTRQYFETNINNHLSCIYLLNAGDYVELVLAYVGGTSHTLLSDCFFCMARLD